MCDPVSIGYAALAMSAAGTAYQYDSSRKTANAQQHNINVASANELMDLNLVGIQKADQKAQEQNKHVQESRKDMALFDAVAGEYGGGISVDRNRGIKSINDSEALATLQRNADNTMQDISRQVNASNSITQQRLASINRPSGFGAALQIGSGALNAYEGYLKNKK